MSVDRRGFLKVFGVTAAVVPVVSSQAETTFETVKDKSVEPLAPFVVLPPDVQRGRLYSAAELWPWQAKTDTYNFFDYAVRLEMPGTGRRAEYKDTNISSACQLNAPESFLVERVGIVFSPESNADLRNRFIGNHILTVWIGQKQFFRRPLAEIFSVTDLDANPLRAELPVKGMADLEPLPLYLPPLMHFRADISGSLPGGFDGMLRLWVVFDGFHARSVQ